MEDLPGISDTEQAAFCVELGKRLNMQRRQDHLCDTTLVTKDGRVFRAHRNVLSAASPFIFNLLQSDVKESLEGIVRFEGISGAVMEDILEFIYTGSVEITQDNSKDLVAAANYLLVPGLKRLNMQRRQNHLCDATLVTKDGREFKAHRNVLSAASPFLFKLLQSDMKESLEGIVQFKEISGAVMEDVLEFIYTGSVELTQDNSKDLIATANYLLIPGLKNLSTQFLERQISKSNCISTFYFAEMYQCDDLITNTRKFIHANFASVAEMDEFLNLEVKEVERWISSDDISVAVEADVFEIILKWIEQNKRERKASFEQLFRHVRLPFLSRDFLIDVVTNELVEGNFDCFKLLSQALKLTRFSSEENLLQSPRKGLETCAIVTCGGKYTFCYLPEKDQWKRLADGLTEVKQDDTEMINYRGQLYAFPVDGTVERYDPVFDCWSTLDRLEWPTGEASWVTFVKGKIYSIDVDTPSRISTIKRFNAERCSWQTVLSSHKGCRLWPCVVAAGHHLYVCGGKVEDDFGSKTAERFDTVENKWEDIASMQQARGCAFGVATEGKIFVAGGRQDWELNLETCEMFNISTNEWHLIGSLKVPRMNGSMVCLKGTLYVLGGSYQDWGSNLNVECYDPTEDKWMEKTTIPVKMICKDSFTGCVLKISNGVLDKLDVVKK